MRIKLVSFKESFTDAPWSSPESLLSPEAYCQVCLQDKNPAGKEKKKGNCHLPYKSTPGGPVNKGALRAIAAALGGARGSSISLSSEERAKFERLRKAAGIGDGEKKA